MVYLLSIVSSMSFLKRFALLCILALWAVSAEAATYYVRTGGSDGHNCGQAQTDNDSNAKGSIQGGVNCVTGPGDTVMVHGGTYGNYGQNMIPPNVNGNASNYITLRAASGETVWLRGILGFWEGSAEYWIVDGINLDGGYWPNNCAGNPDSSSCRANVGQANPHVRFQNLEAKNASYYGIAMSSDSEMINVRSHDHGNCAQCLCGGNPAQAGGQCHGFYLGTGNTGGALFDRVEAYNLDGNGITIDYSASGASQVVISNSKFHHNGSGLMLLDVGPVVVYNSLIYSNNNATGYSSGPIQYYNNTFENNELALTGGNNTLRNNIFYNSSISVGGGSHTYSNNLCTSAGTGCTLVGNPQFVNTSGGDFHLQAGSPAINAGLTVSEVTTDLDKTPRPQGGQFDIGAYEYTNSAPRLVSAPANFRRAGQ
jgi:hypothetical protein